MICQPINTIYGAYIIEPRVLQDDYGCSFELYNKEEFLINGMDAVFVQENHVASKKWVLSGVHAAVNFPYEKLISCKLGGIFDVLVDVRKDSPTYRNWFGIELNEGNRKEVYIPKGVAHGYLALKENTEISFLVSDFFHPGDEVGFIWNDPEINIEWPELDCSYCFAEKDTKWKSFKETF